MPCCMVGGMVQNSTNQNHYQHQQPICSSTFFFYINNKIRPTSTINIIINIRNMPNSTTRENQQQQKFLFSSTTICLTTNIVNSIRCKSPVSYLISHYVICQLTVSLSFLKNVVHFSFISQNIIEIWRFLLTIPGAVKRVSL